jgi:hypothetical protein
MEVSGQRHAPTALPQGKRPWCPLDSRLGGPQSRSGRGGEEINFQMYYTNSQRHSISETCRLCKSDAQQNIWLFEPNSPILPYKFGVVMQDREFFYVCDIMS